jgi:hypothetical protein
MRKFSRMVHKRGAAGSPERARRRSWLQWSVALLLLLDLALGACVWQANRSRAQPPLYDAKVQVRHTAAEHESASVNHGFR